MSPEHQGQQQPPQPQQLMMTMSSHLGQPTSQHLTLTAALNAEMISGGFSGMITTSTQPAIAIGGGGGGGGGGHMILESNSNSSTTSSSGTVTPTGVVSTPSLSALPSLTQPVVAASSQQQQQLQLGTAVKRQRNRHAKSPVTAKPSLRSNSNSGKRPLRPLRPLSQTVANCYCFFLYRNSRLADAASQQASSSDQGDQVSSRVSRAPKSMMNAFSAYSLGNEFTLVSSSSTLSPFHSLLI